MAAPDRIECRARFATLRGVLQRAMESRDALHEEAIRRGQIGRHWFWRATDRLVPTAVRQRQEESAWLHIAQPVLASHAEFLRQQLASVSQCVAVTARQRDTVHAVRRMLQAHQNSGDLVPHHEDARSFLYTISPVAAKWATISEDVAAQVAAEVRRVGSGIEDIANFIDRNPLAAAAWGGAIGLGALALIKALK